MFIVATAVICPPATQSEGEAEKIAWHLALSNGPPVYAYVTTFWAIALGAQSAKPAIIIQTICEPHPPRDLGKPTKVPSSASRPSQTIGVRNAGFVGGPV